MYSHEGTPPKPLHFQQHVIMFAYLIVTVMMEQIIMPNIALDKETYKHVIK